MKYLDYTSTLGGEAANIALFSTFQFDPNFFEQRLLRCTALKKARRIAVFMDASQWCRLMQHDVPARSINRRYLVVPVRKSQGVFHPKLNLLLTGTGGQVQVGSNNLTRSGCASNLELLNSLPFEFGEAEHAPTMSLARDALRFFREAAKNTDPGVSRIANEWLSEVEKIYPWAPEGSGGASTQLVHTYDGPIWDEILKALQGEVVKRFLVVSPFHDKDGRLCKKLAERWPSASVEMLVQQGYTTLPVAPLRSLDNFSLSEIMNASRRVHAKLLAWETENGSGCIVGSANFTTAAMSGTNIEAVLLMRDTQSSVEALFDSQLDKRSIELDEFEPGSESSPEDDDWAPASVQISSVILDEHNRLHVTYRHRLEHAPDQVRLTLRAPGEKHPRISLQLEAEHQGTHKVLLPEDALKDAHGTLLATIIATVSGKQVESPPAWVIQEHRLTYEAGTGSSSSKSLIEETGQGLPEFIDEIANRDGIQAAAEFLRRLNIRFFDGSGRGAGNKKFRVRITDPFESGKVPDWLVQSKGDGGELRDAVMDFVTRHDKTRLRRHSERGNINGMENFVDILTSLVQLLYRYYQFELIDRLVVVSRLCSWCELTTSGRETGKDTFGGYLYSAWDHLGGDEDLLQRVCDENALCANITAILLIAQKLRYVRGEVPKYGPAPLSQKDVLERQAKIVTDGFDACGLLHPSRGEVREVLEKYNMFSDEEVHEMLAAL